MSIERVSDKHRQHLRESGLSDETIRAAELYSVDGRRASTLLRWDESTDKLGQCLAFPYRDMEGKTNGYVRIKPDNPRTDGKGKPVKYEAPKGRENRAYFPPGFVEAFATAPRTLITEGEKKTLCATQAGYVCVGLAGVWSWQQRRLRTDTGRAYGARKLIADLELLNWKDKKVYIVFDNDAAENPSVRLAEARLAEALDDKGADVLVIRIPWHGSKLGLDDFIVQHGVEAFGRLVDAAEPAEKPKPPGFMDFAKMFLDEECLSTDGLTIRWHRDVFYLWKGNRYAEVPRSDLRAVVLEWLDTRVDDAKPYAAGEVTKCLESLCRVPHETDRPTWLCGGEELPEPNSVIAFENCLLDAATIGGDMATFGHTPAWFSVSSLPYSFDPQADCPEWKKFLQSSLGDPERIELLQRWFGLLLTPDTSHQKFMLMVGPKAAGKGTTTRIIQHVFGHDNCAAPTLSSLASEFGLWPLVDKPIAIMADAHLGRRTDSTLVLERIKSIVGEDAQDINRKHLSYLKSVRLNTRFIITVNELPSFPDASGALERRLLVLPFEKSFSENPDRTLETKLKAEAPGILNWSLEGLRRLRAAGKFNTPEKSREIIENYRRMTTPTRAFLEDYCELTPAEGVACEDLYEADCVWAAENGHKRLTAARFGELLRTSDSGILRKRVGPRGSRTYHYVGVTLTDDAKQKIEMFRESKSGRRAPCPSVP